jgi:phosphatidylserine/phosphatidylglycerophosphate/cardiolipin synthase-like enzyme
LALLVGGTANDASREFALRTVRLPALDGREAAPLHDGEGMDLDAWEEQLDELVGGHRSFGKIELLIDGDEYFPALASAIANAQESIKLRTYIFDTDDVSLAVADQLKARSADVDVNIMFDGLGTLMAAKVVTQDQPVLENKPVTIAGYLKQDSNIDVHNLTNPWFTGDHVKTTIIDSNTAFIGGMNIGREYRYDWHDVMVRAEGTIVGDMEYEFDKKWEHSRGFGDLRLLAKLLKQRLRGRQPKDGYEIRAIMTRSYASDLYRAQLAAIRNARGYIFIENSYFSDTTILHALVEARLRGVDVRVIMSLDGNHGIMNQANVIAANILLRAGARIYNYHGMSHVKAAVYDGWAILGSANFDRLSFRVNLEMNLASSAPEFTEQVLERIFEADFADSEELIAPLQQTWRHSVASIVASQL